MDFKKIFTVITSFYDSQRAILKQI